MKKIVIAISVFISLLVLFVTVFTYFKNQEISVTQKVNDRKLNIALVNEDTGGKLRNQSYNFGDDFTTLLSKDQTNKWSVMPRNVAENRFDHGSIDVIVYIEQQFSNKIVQLESFNPSKAKIAYKTKSNLNPEKATKVELRVGEYLNSLNQNVIKMYFSSVVNNLDDAKRNVENIVNEQAGTHTKISQYIYNPSSEASQQLTGVNGFASTLQQNNSSFEDAQKSMTDSVNTLLEATGTSLVKQLTEVKSYFDLQKEISEKNLLAANKSLEQQFNDNNKIFEGLYESLNTSLQAFSTSREAGSAAPLTEKERLQALINKYNNDMLQYRKEIADKKKELEEIKNDLELQKQKVAHNFFGKTEVDLSENKSNIQKLTENARTALAGQIDNSLKQDNHLPNSFKEMVNLALAGSSTNVADYTVLFAKLKEMGALTSEQINDYSAKLNLLNNYSKFVGGVTTSSAPSFEFLNVQDDQLNPIEGVIPITVQLPQGKVATSSTATTEESTAATGNLPSSTTSSNAPSTTSTVNATISVEKNSNSTVDASVELAEGTKEIKDFLPHQLSIRYHFTPKVGENTISFVLHIGNTRIPMTKTIYISDKKDEYILVKKDLTKIFARLGSINQATGMVQALYASPGQASVNFDSISPDSVYKMYGNISRKNIESQLSAEQVEKYRDKGKELLTDIDAISKKLQNKIRSLPELDDKQMPNSYFEEGVVRLTEWHNIAVNSLNSEYDKWKKTTVQKLGVISANASSDVVGFINNDGGASKQLYSSIEALVNTTLTGAKDTTRNQRAVGTMKTQFDQLLNQVSSVKNNVEKTASTTNELITTEANNIKENKTYSDSFKAMLKNARNGGTTNQKVIDFLSQPVEVKKEAKASQPISTKNNNLWIIAAVLVSCFTSIAATYWLTRAKFINE